MSFLIALVACSGGQQAVERPSNVPENAQIVRLDATGAWLGDQAVASREELERDMVDGIQTGLLEALDPSAPAWISAPAETPWMVVRKLVFSAHEAGIAERWVSVDGVVAAFGPSTRPKSRFMPGCKDGKQQVTGVSRRLTVELFQGSDGTWVETAVHFDPQVNGVSAIALPPSCWEVDSTGCDAMGELAPACEAGKEQALQPPEGLQDGDRVPARVPVAGPIGCILPIRKRPGDESAWPGELSKNLGGLGITADDEATLLVEANVPWTAVVSVLQGFSRAGLPIPALGLPLVEGHGSPPLCSATIRDAATLQTAGAKWFGSRLLPPREAVNVQLH